MKPPFIYLFLVGIFFTLFACEEDSTPPEAIEPLVENKTCSISDYELEGNIHGNSWKVQASSGRIKYYTILDPEKVGQIKEIELRLYDTLFNACERVSSPRLTPIVQLTLPPKLGTFPTDSFPFYPVTIFYNDTVTTSFNSIAKGCVTIDEIDTNATGRIYFHLDTKIINEYWDLQGNVLRKDSSTLKGKYEVNFCP